MSCTRGASCTLPLSAVITRLAAFALSAIRSLLTAHILLKSIQHLESHTNTHQCENQWKHKDDK